MEDDRPSGSSNRKRSFLEDDDSNKAPPQKRVRFPKGKKVKSGNYVLDEEARPNAPRDPRIAAKDRAMRRSQITAELLDDENRGICDDISQAEVQYEDDETFIDDGIQIEPFNLSKEREEGYFDAEGNYVEYVNENELKDAWLDSVEVDKKFTGKQPIRTDEEDDAPDLSPDDVGKIKRRIADVLEPGETVLLALRRLKGTSNKKEKMSAETKVVFDQLTEDAMKLLENGDYDVYNEKQENFQREAEGYERLAQARGQVISMNSGVEIFDNGVDKDLVPNGTKMASSATVFDMDAGPSKLNNDTTSNGDDAVDMFAEDDENATVNPASGGSGGVSYQDLGNQNQPPEGKDLQSDYVYDETSGYYYSSSSGYYYDPSSGLYCCAASGQWYSYNEESRTYEEVQQAASDVS